MNTRERFEKVRQEQRNRFSLRTRLTALVTLEMLVCVLISYGVDQLLNKVFPWEVPLELELVSVCLLVGILVTSQLSKFFFNPIKKLRGAMDKVADGDFSVRLEEKSSSKEIMEIYTGFNLMAHELNATEILQTDFVSNVSHEFKTPINAIEGYDLCKKRISIGSQDCSTVDALKQCKVPVLFIHGADDNFVPVRMTHENYAACASEKHLLIVPDADHAMSYCVEQDHYEKAVTAFWKAYDV